MRFAAFALGLLLIEGCAGRRDPEPATVDPDPVIAPSGNAAHIVRCEDGGECIRAAGEQCPDGYKMRDVDTRREIDVTSFGVASGSATAQPTSGGGAFVTGSAVGVGTSTATERKSFVVLVECRHSGDRPRRRTDGDDVPIAEAPSDEAPAEWPSCGTVTHPKTSACEAAGAHCRTAGGDRLVCVRDRPRAGSTGANEPAEVPACGTREAPTPEACEAAGGECRSAGFGKLACVLPRK